MRLKEVIRAPKFSVVYGKWENGPNKKASFPVQRSGRGLLFGPQFRWRVVTFQALGASFRILCAMCARKQVFLAALGEDCGKDTRVIIVYEYHASHGGWHVHSACHEFEDLPIGRARGPHMKRIPKAAGKTSMRNQGFPASEDAAFDRVCKKFGLYADQDENGQWTL